MILGISAQNAVQKWMVKTMEIHEALYKDVSSLEVVAYTTRDGDFEDGVTFILEKLDAIPVADVQPVRHGKWIDRKIAYICDRCRCGADRRYSYCPYCGAEMEMMN